MKIIELKNINFAYPASQKLILEDVSLEIASDDFIGILGPNGGGKSTLLKLILGLLKPCKGELHLYPKKSSAHLGYVPQFSTFRENFPLTVLNMVLMGGLGSRSKFYTYSKQEKLEAEEVMESLQILHLKDRQISSLSGGEMQRALIGRSILSHPQALLLDEPTASVDQSGEAGIYKLLAELNKKMAIVLISHDVGFVSKYVKRIACINRKLSVHTAGEFDASMIEKSYGYEVKNIQHHHHNH